MYTGVSVGQSFLDVASSITPVVEFYINTLLKQVADVFPGEYISIGADECYNFSKVGYIRAVKRMEQIINGLGKNMMGWEEIYIATENPNTIAQAWNQGSSGENVIYTRCERMYLDHPQRVGDQSTNDWCVPGGQVTLKTVYDAYSFIPQYLGVEATCWGEWTVWERGYHDRQIFPRLSAVAEVSWTSPGRFNWIDFRVRVAPFGARFDMMGMSWYTKENLVDWERRTVYQDDINVYTNFDWGPIVNVNTPVTNRSYTIMGPSELHIFDMKGRTILIEKTKKLRTMQEISRAISGQGVYLVKLNGIVTKILK